MVNIHFSRLCLDYCYFFVFDLYSVIILKKWVWMSMVYILFPLPWRFHSRFQLWIWFSIIYLSLLFNVFAYHKKIKTIKSSTYSLKFVIDIYSGPKIRKSLHVTWFYIYILYIPTQYVLCLMNWSYHHGCIITHT